MVKRLPNRFIGECSSVFVVHHNVKDFIHNNSKIYIYKFIWQSFNHHKLPMWQTSFRKKPPRIIQLCRSDTFVSVLNTWVSSGGGLVVGCDSGMMYWGKHMTVNKFVEQLGMSFFLDLWRGPDIEVSANRARKARIGEQMYITYLLCFGQWRCHFLYRYIYYIQYRFPIRDGWQRQDFERRTSWPKAPCCTDWAILAGVLRYQNSWL